MCSTDILPASWISHEQVMWALYAYTLDTEAIRAGGDFGNFLANEKTKGQDKVNCPRWEWTLPRTSSGPHYLWVAFSIGWGLRLEQEQEGVVKCEQVPKGAYYYSLWLTPEWTILCLVCLGIKYLFSFSVSFIKTFLSGYNLHIIKFTNYKITIRWIFTNVPHPLNHHPDQDRTFLVPQKAPSCPRQVNYTSTTSLISITLD